MAADKIDLPKDAQIAIEPFPTEAAIRESPVYANAARVVYDQNGFTIYFFVTPPDVMELPTSKEQIGKQLEQHRMAGKTGAPPTTLKVTTQSDAVAKIVLPTSLMQSFMQALAFTFASWATTFGRGERHGRADDTH